MTLEALKILAIDDNADNLITLRAVVRDALPLAAVVTAANGPQGIAQAQAEDPDVVLLDIVMPGMDGYEACRRLKADERTRHIPVVFLTALRADRESRVRALEAGAEAFLAKPLDEVELTAQIRAMAKIKAANVLARQEKEHLAALVGERTADLERELAERRLVEAAERLHAAQLGGIYRAAPVGIGMLVNRVFQEVNDTLCRMTGYAREELLGQSARILYSTQDEFDYVGREKYRQIAQQAVGTVETHWQRKDSGIIDVLISSAALDPTDLTRGVSFSALDITERKRTERALRESEDKFKYVFDHSMVAKSLTLPTGEINVNQAFADMLGYTRAALENLKWQDITHPDDLALSQNVITALLSGAEASLRFKKRYLRRDGGVVWTDISTSLRRDHEGKPLYFMTAVSDITAQVQADAALRLERDRAQGYLDIAGVMLVAFDAEDKVILINQRGTEILGCRQEEIIGKDWVANFLPPRSRDQVRAVFSSLLAGEVGPGLHYENPILTAGGEERIVAWHNATLKDEAGRISGILSSGEDITERKRAEAALRESEEKFRTITEQMTDMVFVSDGTGTVTYVSPAAEPLFGFTPAEMQGRPFTDFLTETDIPTAAAASTAAIAAGIPSRNLELRMQRKDGSVFTGELSGTPYQRDDLRGNMGLIRDVTERKQAEEQLCESEARFRAVLDATPFPIAVVDLADEKIHFWSHSALTLFGHTASTTAEWYRIAYPDPDYRREVLARWKPLLDLARPTHQALNTGEYRVTCSDGSIRVCELYAALLADTLIVTFNDITERRQAEDKIRQQLHELQRWYNVTLERETRSLAIKHEVNELLRRLGEPIRYPSAEK